MFYLCADNINGIMAVELTGQQVAFLLQKVSNGNLIKAIDIFFCDEIAFLRNKVQPLLVPYKCKR